jgi:mono/diheme cytochrome c family protein
MHAMPLTIFAPAMLAGLLVMASAGSARAQAQAAGQNAESGSEIFGSYCASCHGATAHGNGSVAQYLKIPPADLTQIAKRNKGVFDAEKVYRIIDGREVVKPHGKTDKDKSEMPVWGDAFMRSSTTGGDEKVVSSKIRALVQYLQAIQEKPAK